MAELYELIVNDGLAEILFHPPLFQKSAAVFVQVQLYKKVKKWLK